MKTNITHPFTRAMKSLIIVGLLTLAAGVRAQTPTVSLSGPGYLYRSTSHNYTSFTISLSSAPTSPLLVTFLLGGNGTVSGGSGCDYAFAGSDFNIWHSTLTVHTAPIPNGFYVTFPAGVSSATITVVTTNTADGCTNGEQLLYCSIPDPSTGDITSQATAYIEPNPGIVASIGAPSNVTIYKSTLNSPRSTTFTVTSSTTVNFDLEVDVFIGGDGTGESSNPCYAAAGADFNVTSGNGNLPFPGGYKVIIPAGQTTGTITAQAIDNSTGCNETGNQTLYCWIISGLPDYTRNGSQYISTAYEVPDLN